jgi:hypothetical protein
VFVRVGVNVLVGVHVLVAVLVGVEVQGTGLHGVAVGVGVPMVKTPMRAKWEFCAHVVSIVALLPEYPPMSLAS